jgi:hypothetical protein
LKMHQNVFFYFLKIIFDISALKMIWKHQKYINLKLRKKNSIFLKNTFETQKQTGFYETQLKNM